MPVDGLPNPHLHAICRRCGKWHERSEGSQVEAGSLNPLRLVMKAGARIAERDAPTQFVCFLCQAKATSSRRSVWISLIILAVLATVLWFSGLLDGLVTLDFTPRRH